MRRTKSQQPSPFYAKEYWEDERRLVTEYRSMGAALFRAINRAAGPHVKKVFISLDM